MIQVSPQTAYENLSLLEQVDSTTGAVFRELAQDVLGDPQVSMDWREAIAERLNAANHQLELQTVGKNDSY